MNHVAEDDSSPQIVPSPRSPAARRRADRAHGDCAILAAQGSRDGANP